MKDEDKDLLEKAGAFALGVPAALMAGNMAGDVANKNHLWSDVSDKVEQMKRNQAPSGTEGPKVTQAKPVYSKGGKVKTFRHHDGIAQRGKTRA